MGGTPTNRDGHRPLGEEAMGSVPAATVSRMHSTLFYHIFMCKVTYGCLYV